MTAYVALLRGILESQGCEEVKTHIQSGNVVFHAPDGIARSKLVEKVDRCLGVQTTSRNWRTVSKIAELAEATIS
jgi:uncharacterized protein (DUF1697 family)